MKGQDGKSKLHSLQVLQAVERFTPVFQSSLQVQDLVNLGETDRSQGIYPYYGNRWMVRVPGAEGVLLPLFNQSRHCMFETNL